MTTDEPYIPIDQAAKAVGMGRDQVRRLAIDNAIARRWGGSEAHPWIRVKLSELRKVIDSRRVFRASGQKKSTRRDVAPIHPLVTC